MWAKNYSKCQICKTVKHPHLAKGLCGFCYRKKNKVKIKEQIRRNYILNRDLTLLRFKENRENRNFDGKRISVLERDNYICQICGEEGSIVHHKDGKGRSSKIKNNNKRNLITVCRACHVILHKDDLLSKRKFNPGSYLKMRNQWSYKFDKCINCQTTSIRHAGKGLCKNCYISPCRKREKIKI